MVYVGGGSVPGTVLQIQDRIRPIRSCELLNMRTEKCERWLQDTPQMDLLCVVSGGRLPALSLFSAKY